MKKANKIVSIIKEHRDIIMTLQDNEDIDFIGCSENYCEEKINVLITELKNLKAYLKRKEKENILKVYN